MKKEEEKDAILVTGSGQLAFSITVCLLQAGNGVVLFTEDTAAARHNIDVHLSQAGKGPAVNLQIVAEWPQTNNYRIAIVVTIECAEIKKERIRELEKILPADAIIAINTESIPLNELQEAAAHPARIIGANWVEPAHTTFFLELIMNTCNRQELVDELYRQASRNWGKDPYIIAGNAGIRAKMLSAMAREAFFLVENGYASIEDIDRACRNDAGYYLPFAGNFRYMDLMGPYAYGLVMKDLNPGLSEEKELPAFLEALIAAGHTGMETNKGFYEYREGEAEKWKTIFGRFSYRIQQLISRYPFPGKDQNGSQNNDV